MPAATTDERRRSFDQMAQLYARARGAPPPALFDALAVFVHPPADALEIGCGPGNASLPLLERGFRIHAVELGENLAAFARERLAAFPFTVEVGKFEDAPLQPASVDLVVCSSAFHWLDRERALHQVVKVLKPGGALALVWGSPRRTTEDNRVDEAIQAAYRAHAPEISRQTVDRMGGKIDEIGQAVCDAPELREFEERLFPQTHLFDRQCYLDTLATFSDHATLPAAQRARLFEAIGEIIDGQLGGHVERHSTARLQLARRRMKKSTRFVGLDVHKETIAVAEVGGEVRSLGTIPNDLDAVRRLVQSGPPVVDAAPDSVTDAKTDADAGCQHEFMVAAYGGPAYCVEADGAIVLIPRP